MKLTGKQFIGNDLYGSGPQRFSAVNPENGQLLEGEFYEATDEEVNLAVQLAEQAYQEYANTSSEERATFLDRIGEEIMALGDVLIERAMTETALPRGRLQGERGRTVNQLKLFASVVREGSYVDARIDTAQKDRSPIPKQDIRHVMIPLGPVGIFGASNFPLAFSVAGGDSASALASGCPVIVKGHPAHPGTSELVATAILKAANETAMPNGVFSMVQGQSHQVGSAIVQHPMITAIGFTGSFRGGKALFDLANQRPHPIPVYAEMGSINPVFILPGALNEKGESIAKGLSSSLILGVGQFCTNPGLVVLPESESNKIFKSTLVAEVEKTTAGTMLSEGIQSAYLKGTDQLAKAGLHHLAGGQKNTSSCGVAAHVFATSATDFLRNPNWSEEVFGPSTILVQSSDIKEIYRVAQNLEGHLTATIHGTREDLKAHSALIEILKRKVGRILINGYPTGVEVCPSMVHGGPFPSTTDVRSTSVGTNAIKRFIRPVCYQNFEEFLLPPELQNANPVNIWRMVNGEMTKENILSS